MEIWIYSDPEWSNSCLSQVTRDVKKNLELLGHRVIWVGDRGTIYEKKPPVVITITFPSFLFEETEQLKKLAQSSVLIGHWDSCASWTYPEGELLRSVYDGHLVALKRDYEIGLMRKLENIYWSPRGVDKELFHNKEKSPTPFIMISGGEDNPDFVSYIGLALDAAREVKKVIPELRVLTWKNYDLTTDLIKRGPVERFSLNYLPAWTYLNPWQKGMKDINRFMLGGYFPDIMPTYELGVIESQMAGCANLGVIDGIQPELINSKTSILTEPTIEAHAEGLLKTIETYPMMQQEARKFALENFDWNQNIKIWEENILKILEGKRK